jgi:hypothetical protein
VQFIRTHLNIGSERYLEDGPLRREQAHSSVKRFLVPPGLSGIVDALVPDRLITDAMIERYLAVRPPQFRVRASFDAIIDEIERSYVLGQPFAAVAASVVAIERMLNDARVRLHAHETEKLKHLWGKGPVNHWRPNLAALVQWGYLPQALADELSDVYEIRCRVLHSGAIDNLELDASRCVRAAFDVLTEFIGFPERLFRIAATIQCTDEASPLFVVFYKPELSDGAPGPSAG